MKTFVPDYYGKFSCIADKCRHSCCVGWEIDIDADTYKYYSSLTGEVGGRLKKSISDEGGTPHFILTADERCPFLNDRNLCDIIASLGEDKLCEICALHPRYRNFFRSRTEIGLGLCCEAAAELILSKESKTEFVMIQDDGADEGMTDDERAFFAARGEILAILQNRALALPERVEELFSRYNIKFPDKTINEWLDIYLNLEQLSDEWTNTLKAAKNADKASDIASDKTDIAFEQIIVYFICRHTPAALDDRRLLQRIAFSALGAKMIYELYKIHVSQGGGDDINALMEIARMYSSEIEYSEENTEQLMQILERPDR